MCIVYNCYYFYLAQNIFLHHGCLTDFTWFQRFHVLQDTSQENEIRGCNPLPRCLVSMRESMEMIDFKNRLFQFQETHLPERKQVLLTVLLILLFCLLLYHGLFRDRWEKEDRFQDQIRQFKAELNSSETVGLS